MGIPSFFREIIKRYPDTHFFKEDVDIDHLYFDFNCLIYHCLPKIEYTNDVEFEDRLIKEVSLYTQHIIVDIVKPKESVSIAFDGSAPRAKMVQQRARRFKRTTEKGFQRYLRSLYPEMPDPDKSWDSRKISPGTVFMKKLSEHFRGCIKAGIFGKGLHFTLSDTSVPGEGEHKVLPEIKRLPHGSKVCIYGLDADLIVLATGSRKDNILILREPKDSEIEKALYENHEFLYISIDELKRGFLEDVEQTVFREEIDIDRVFNDYVFLTFMGGNDFVRPIQFLQVKDGGLDVSVSIYEDILNRTDDDQYLIELKSDSDEDIVRYSDEEEYSINLDLFKMLIDELAKMETSKMAERQKRIDRRRKFSGKDLPRNDIDEEKPWKQMMLDFQHLPYYDKRNPLYDLFEETMLSIDFKKKKRVWAPLYYEHFFGISQEDDMKKYNSEKRKISWDYIKSLCFSLKYYLEGLPSWRWFYPHRVAPLVSDIQFVLKRADKLDFRFKEFRPYHPFSQLMMILPLNAVGLLPDRIGELMREYPELFPERFELDVLAGHKYIYSEPILEEISDDHEIVLRCKNICRYKLNDEERQRNRINRDPWTFFQT